MLHNYLNKSRQALGLPALESGVEHLLSSSTRRGLGNGALAAGSTKKLAPDSPLRSTTKQSRIMDGKGIAGGLVSKLPSTPKIKRSESSAF